MPRPAHPFLRGATIALALLSLTACAPAAEPSPSSDATSASERPAAAEPSPGTAQVGSDLRDAALAVTWQEAVALAQAQFPGEPTSVELDDDHGDWIYTVDLVDSTREFETDISATRGTVGAGHVELQDDDDSDDRTREVLDQNGLVTTETVLTTASAVVSGVPRAWTLHRTDSGRIVFEVTVIDSAGVEREVHIDAVTGDSAGFDD